MMKKRDELEHLARALGHAGTARLAMTRVELHERRAIVSREWPVQKTLTRASGFHRWPPNESVPFQRLHLPRDRRCIARTGMVIHASDNRLYND